MTKRKLSNLTKLPDMRVKFRDVFNLKEFYDSLHEWLLENNWLDTDEGNDHWEEYYNQKEDRTGMREIWIRWRTTKKAPDSTYIRYYLDFDFHVVALTNTEIIKDGQKLKVNKGEVEVILKPAIFSGHIAALEKHSLLKYISNMFVKRIYHKEFEQRKKELYQEAYHLQNYIKQWLKLKRYLPYEEARTFFPSQAWPSHKKEE